MKKTAWLLGFLLGAAAAGAAGSVATAKDDVKRELQVSLNDMGLVGDWIYDDAAEGFAVAKRTGRPLMIVFR